MFTLEDLKKKIEAIKKDNAEKTLDIQRNEAKISVYEDMIKEIEGQKKPLSDNDITRVATEMIKNNPNIERVTAIARKLREEGFDFDANKLGSTMLKTGKFKIDEATKFWVIVE